MTARFVTATFLVFQLSHTFYTQISNILFRLDLTRFKAKSGFQSQFPVVTEEVRGSLLSGG